MSVSLSKQDTLVAAWWPDTEGSKALRQAALVVVGSLLLVASAKISVPFYPVPMTMQTYILLVLAMVYGGRLAGATVILYLLEGALGLPVFAGTPEKGIGIAYMMGSSGGYLLGFVLAVAACGWLADHGWGKHVLSAALAMLIGNVLIYIPGLLWLGSLFGWDKPILEWGLIPFIYGDLLKIALAAATLPVAWTFTRRGGTGT